MSKQIRHLGDLRQDPQNARRHNPRNVGMIVDALHEVGAARSGVIDEDGTILAGNATWEALAEAGIERVRVVEADGNEWVVVQRKGLTEAQKQRLALFDNRAAELADWDGEMLAAIAQQNPEAVRGMWTEDELAAIIGEPEREVPEDPGAQVDRAAELQEKWQVKRGQVWACGRHRLMCGDSTSAEDVARLMGGERAKVCFTSPPYDQQREYGKAIDDWDALMQGVFAVLPMAQNGQVLVNLGLVHQDGEWMPYWDGWIKWMRSQGWRRFGWYVWDQGPGTPGDWAGRFAPSHEFIFHFNRAAVKPAKSVECKNAGASTGKRTFRNADGTLDTFTQDGAAIQSHKIADSVIRVTRQHGAGIWSEHPAVFPVGLPVYILEAWPGNAYDPFLGSGTTMVATEQTGRTCYGMEIEPKYCSVALERMAGMGLEPRLLEG